MINPTTHLSNRQLRQMTTQTLNVISSTGKSDKPIRTPASFAISMSPSDAHSYLTQYQHQRRLDMFVEPGTTLNQVVIYMSRDENYDGLRCLLIDIIEEENIYGDIFYTASVQVTTIDGNTEIWQGIQLHDLLLAYYHEDEYPYPHCIRIDTKF